MKYTLTLLIILSGIFADSGLIFGQTLPNISLKTSNGKKVKIKSLVAKNDFTVVTFWATYCTPCMQELDDMMDYKEEWKDDLNTEVIAINTDETRSSSKVKPIINDKGWDYTMLFDSKEELMRALSYATVPMTFITDKDGNIVYTHNGYISGDEIELDKKLKSLSK